MDSVMAKTVNARKARKTFSLSRETVKYLESLRRQQKKASMSSVLEGVIRQQQQTKEMDLISASVTRYYDFLSAKEIADDRAWGDFAATQFPSEY
jgi:Tfp pilus assembly protein PilO